MTRPVAYTPPAPGGDGTLRTCSGLRIGCAAPAPAPRIGPDEVRIQAALLDPRTRLQQPRLLRIAAAIWRWC